MCILRLPNSNRIVIVGIKVLVHRYYLKEGNDDMKRWCVSDASVGQEEAYKRRKASRGVVHVVIALEVKVIRLKLAFMEHVEYLCHLDQQLDEVDGKL